MRKRNILVVTFWKIKNSKNGNISQKNDASIPTLFLYHCSAIFPTRNIELDEKKHITKEEIQKNRKCSFPKKYMGRPISDAPIEYCG
jgi:hypothetical protein